MIQEYQQRVIDEKAALDEKLSKLGAYLNKPHFTSLHYSEQQRMTTQMHLMVSYSAVLGARIAAFEL